jgi:hypothetical protein
MAQTWLFDFDNNAFWTATPPRGGIGVAAAYELAVDEVLGARALTAYREGGGLRNRTPSEVVQELVPDRSYSEISELAEQLVAVKLSHLVNQIGLPVGDSFWPTPCDGFVSFWRWLAKQEIRTGVISSGHTAFIEQVFQLYSLRLPDVIVSDDDIRRRHYASLRWRVKPGTFQFTLARLRLAREYGESRTSPSFHDKSSITYFGDDALKDGGLAQAAGVCFGHFDPQASVEVTADGFRFPSWKWVQDRFS